MSRPEPISTSELWRKVLSDQRRAWATLVERFEPLVYNVALRVGLDRTQAEDCAQNVWLSLYKHRSTVRDPERLGGWLARAARRRAVRMAQKAAHRKTHAVSRSQPSPTDLPDDELLRLERLAIVQDAIQQLDPRCRRLIEALFFCDQAQSYRQIAEELGLKPNSLGPIRARCLGRLRYILDQMGYR